MSFETPDIPVVDINHVLEAVWNQVEATTEFIEWMPQINHFCSENPLSMEMFMQSDAWIMSLCKKYNLVS